jgi:hypothetical protein
MSGGGGCTATSAVVFNGAVIMNFLQAAPHPKLGALRRRN